MQKEVSDQKIGNAEKRGVVWYYSCLGETAFINSLGSQAILGALVEIRREIKTLQTQIEELKTGSKPRGTKN